MNIIDSHHQPTFFNITLKNFSHALGGWTRGILWTFPIAALRFSALAISVLGQFGRIHSAKWNQKAHQWNLIHYHHNVSKINALILTLCPVKNVPTIHVIRKKEHLKQTKELVQRVTDLHHPELLQLSPEHIKWLRTQGNLSFEGLCVGACLVATKALLSQTITSERELMGFVRQYRNGFPAEAYAVQKVYNSYFNPDFTANTFMLRYINEEFARQQLLAAQEPGIKWNVISYRLCLSFYRQVASLINLKVLSEKEEAFSTFIAKHSAQELEVEMNRFSHGSYLMLPHGIKHALLYLNMPFGAYLLDPNYGLIKCHTKNPASTVFSFLDEMYHFTMAEHEKPHKVPGTDLVSNHMIQVYQLAR